MTTVIRNPRVHLHFFLTLLAAVLAAAHVQDSFVELLLDLVFWGGVYAVGLSCGWQNSQRQQPAYETISQGVAVIAVLVFATTSFAQGIGAATLKFLIWIQAARNVTLSTRRDLYFGFAVSFIVLLYAAAQSKQSSCLLFMVAYALTGTFALVASYLDERQQQAYGGAHHTSRSVALPANITGLSLAILGVSLALYFLIPRPPAAHIGGFIGIGGERYDAQDWLDEAENDPGKADENPPSELAEAGAASEAGEKGDDGSNSPKRSLDTFSYAGFGERLDIHHQSPDRLSNEVVLYLQSDRPLYLRGAVFDTFDDESWQKRFARTQKLKLDNGRLTFGVDDARDLVHQTITLQQDLPSIIVAAERVHMLQFPGDVIARDPYGVLQAPSALKRDTVYSVKSRIVAVADRPASGPEALSDPEPYLQLPTSLPPRIGELAKTVASGADNDLYRAIAIEQHLRNAYQFTFDTVIPSQGRIPLEAFLFATRRGHCEYFATAMAIMLRTQGIPSRLATGFSATNLNPLTGYYEVRGLDAHAWVEAYFPEHGWVLFEPTAYYNLPSDQPAPSTGEALMAYVQNLAKAAEISAPASIGTSILSASATALRRLKQRLKDIWRWIGDLCTTVWHLFSGYGMYVLLAGLLLGVLIYYGRYPVLATFSHWRLTQVYKGSNQAFALACYDELERLCTRYGLRRKAALTIDEYQAWLLSIHPNLQEPLQAITEGFRVARYRDIASESHLETRPLFAGFQTINRRLLHTVSRPSPLGYLRRADTLIPARLRSRLKRRRPEG
jgi:transglutaminase-like putative cysteine protease